MPAKIFVNYRREDAKADARQLHERLRAAFGRDSVFMDVDNLLAGQRFDEQLNLALEKCDIFLAVIGPRWAAALADRTQAGKLDYVRTEIATALGRRVIVIPVLVDGATMPDGETLPDDIRDLVYHQKHDLTHERYGRDVGDLIAAIKAIRKGASKRSPVVLRQAALILLGVGLIGTGAVLLPQLWVPSVPKQPSTQSAEASIAQPLPSSRTSRFLARPMWSQIKQGHPDWYDSQIATLTQLSADGGSEQDIAQRFLSAFTDYRRSNSDNALAASTTKHKELAHTFLTTLRELSRDSGDACYEFISKGESAPAIFARFVDPDKSVVIEAQIIAVLAAIADGREHLIKHNKPIKTDYDALARELGQLGWTHADMQLFANPNELAKAPRDRICRMLQDWFSAHLSIQDPAIQERLLFETLKPVTSG